MKKQGGLTFMSWLVVIAIALFFLMIGLKMVPSYLENYSLKQVLNNVSTDFSLRGKSHAEILRTIEKRLNINGVYDFPASRFKFVQGPNNSEQIEVKYEVREPVIGNVSVVMAFHDKVPAPPQ